MKHTGLIAFLGIAIFSSQAQAVQFYHAVPAVSQNIPVVPKDQIKSMALVEIDTGQTIQKSLDSLSLDDLSKLDTKSGPANGGNVVVSSNSQVAIPVTVAVAVPDISSTPASVTSGLPAGAVGSVTSPDVITNPTNGQIVNVRNLIINPVPTVNPIGGGILPVDSSFSIPSGSIPVEP